MEDKNEITGKLSCLTKPDGSAEFSISRYLIKKIIT